MTLLEDFDIGQCIGKGGFAMVYKATKRSLSPDAILPRTHAIKIIVKEEMLKKNLSLQRIRNEIDIHAHLRHPNIVQYIDR